MDPKKSATISLPAIMPMATLVPEPSGIFPLTLFDDVYANAGIVMGWLVEGMLDLNLISGALDRLVAKWPILAGRLEATTDNDKSKYQIRFPLRTWPNQYPTYTLTSTVSAVPISSFVSLPLPVFSASPPKSIFLHSSTPKSSATWASRGHPLTCWHITYFPHGGEEYTCVGVAFSHGLFDGMGISYVVHALEAEMLGRDWEVPPSPHEGLNVNVLQESLDVVLNQSSSPGEDRGIDSRVTYRGITAATTWTVVVFFLWHLWQQWWHRAEGRVIILPTKAYSGLVDRTRNDLEAEGISDVRLSTGDVLAAWFFKTIYSDETPFQRIVHCSNMASIRSFYSERVKRYPFNCFLPVPYPTISVGELQSMPLHVLAHSFALARSSLSMVYPLSLNRMLVDASRDKRVLGFLPFNPDADETLTMSNMSIARIVDIDWTGVGGKTTICRYKSILSDNPVLISNILTIAGRTHDGGIVLDVVLNKKRLIRLEAEVQKLIDTGA